MVAFASTREHGLRREWGSRTCKRTVIGFLRQRRGFVVSVVRRCQADSKNVRPSHALCHADCRSKTDDDDFSIQEKLVTHIVPSFRMGEEKQVALQVAAHPKIPSRSSLIFCPLTRTSLVLIVWLPRVTVVFLSDVCISLSRVKEELAGKLMCIFLLTCRHDQQVIVDDLAYRRRRGALCKVPEGLKRERIEGLKRGRIRSTHDADFEFEVKRKAQELEASPQGIFCLLVLGI